MASGSLCVSLISMKRSVVWALFLAFTLSAWAETPFSVDLRNLEVKAAAPGSRPASGFRRVVFSRATVDPSRDYALTVLPPDRFSPTAFREGTRPQDPPVPSVMAFQSILEYLGYGAMLRWTDPETGKPGNPVDGAYGLSTRRALQAFLADVGFKQDAARVDRPLYGLLYQIFLLARTGAEPLARPVPGQAPPAAEEAPTGMPEEALDLPHLSPPAAAPMTDHSQHTPQGMAAPDEATQALTGTPSDLPWNILYETWLTLETAEQARYETAAREELAKDGSNAALALKILLQHGWKQNRKTLVKGTEGIWLPRRFWKE